MSLPSSPTASLVGKGTADEMLLRDYRLHFVTEKLKEVTALVAELRKDLTSHHLTNESESW